jgi:nitrite reductase (NADH) small subunit
MESPRGPIALFRTVEDEVFAVLDRCPHKGGPLSQGIVHDRKVACPLHNWVIDLAAGEAVAPDHGCVKRYPVRLEAGRVFLQLAEV